MKLPTVPRFKTKLRIERGVLNGLLLTEILTESLPQILLTVVNTAMMGNEWTFFGVLTISFSTVALSYLFFKIIVNVTNEGKRTVSEWVL